MEKLAELLKQARQDQQISLREISEQTKIQVRYLEALEAGDFTSFSGEVYIKGALKNYAEAVGLDPQEVLELYHNLKGEPPVAAAPEIELREKPPAPPSRFERAPSFTYGLIVVLLLLVAGGYWFTSQHLQKRLPLEPDPSGNQAEPVEPAEPDATKPDRDAEPRPAPAAGIEMAEAESTSLETVFTVANAEQLELQLLCNERCWIKMLVDDHEQFQPRIFQQGEELAIEAKDQIWIRLGNPRGVKITINGIEVAEINRQKNAHNFQFVRK